ncbi:MAG: GNAT family N-acetyltransferase [Chloroflexota bacterium]|nr:GNAT family N-acetyltransferase [Dehalococcoidia bacterium]MDW8252404.1 GNAT family N-acetyltransferase [Chloroflexota bacterium]
MMSDRILPLEPADVALLRIPWLSNYDTTSLARQLAASDAPSFWIPATGEYVVGGWWRGRREIGSVLELAARGANSQQLVERLVAAFVERGVQAVVPSISEVWRDGRWYRSHGFSELDRIVTMVLAPLRVPEPSPAPLELRPYQPRYLDALIAVDRASFPWLWWNDPHDFERYEALPEVTVLTGWVGEELVSYASSTVRGARGHLDRLAVRRADQGRGFGRAMLLGALADLAARGAREVALTTQVTNRVAQALYRSVGFRQTDEVETILGRWTNRPSIERSPITAQPG